MKEYLESKKKYTHTMFKSGPKNATHLIMLQKPDEHGYDFDYVLENQHIDNKKKSLKIPIKAIYNLSEDFDTQYDEKNPV